MKKIAVIILLLLVTIVSYSQTRSHYPDWRNKKSAELEGGAHTPLIYSGTVTLSASSVATNWMLLGWASRASSADQDTMIHFAPARWSVVLSLDEYGAGDSVGLGGGRWELAFDTTASSIWIVDSSNVFCDGIASDSVDGTADTVAFAYPLGIPFPAYGRLVFDRPDDVNDTVSVAYTAIGTSFPEDIYGATKTQKVSFDSIDFRKSVSVDNLPDTAKVTITNLSSMSPMARDTFTADSACVGVDSVTFTSSPVGNLNGFFRTVLTVDSLVDSVDVFFNIEDTSGVDMMTIPSTVYIDTIKTLGKARAYTIATNIPFLANARYWGCLYDPSSTAPIDAAIMAGWRFKVHVVQRGTDSGSRTWYCEIYRQEF